MIGDPWNSFLEAFKQNIQLFFFQQTPSLHIPSFFWLYSLCSYQHWMERKYSLPRRRSSLRKNVPSTQICLSSLDDLIISFSFFFYFSLELVLWYTSRHSSHLLHLNFHTIRLFSVRSIFSRSLRCIWNLQFWLQHRRGA